MAESQYEWRYSLVKNDALTSKDLDVGREETPDLFRNSTIALFERMQTIGTETETSDDEDDDESQKDLYPDEMECDEVKEQDNDVISEEDEEMNGLSRRKLVPELPGLRATPDTDTDHLESSAILKAPSTSADNNAVPDQSEKAFEEAKTFVAAPAPPVQQSLMDKSGAPFGADPAEFTDLDFPPIDGPDVLENFDFDSFLHVEDAQKSWPEVAEISKGKNPTSFGSAAIFDPSQTLHIRRTGMPEDDLRVDTDVKETEFSPLLAGNSETLVPYPSTSHSSHGSSSVVSSPFDRGFGSVPKGIVARNGGGHTYDSAMSSSASNAGYCEPSPEREACAKMFQCSFCPRRFVQADSLRSHLSSHSHLSSDEKRVLQEAAKRNKTEDVELLDDDPLHYAKLTREVTSSPRTVSSPGMKGFRQRVQSYVEKGKGANKRVASGFSDVMDPTPQEPVPQPVFGQVKYDRLKLTPSEPPVSHEPNTVFATARAAELVQNVGTSSGALAGNVAPFKPHTESPSTVEKSTSAHPQHQSFDASVLSEQEFGMEDSGLRDLNIDDRNLSGSNEDPGSIRYDRRVLTPVRLDEIAGVRGEEVEKDGKGKKRMAELEVEESSVFEGGLKRRRIDTEGDQESGDKMVVTERDLVKDCGQGVLGPVLAYSRGSMTVGDETGYGEEEEEDIVDVLLGRWTVLPKEV
ncbi:uncharacterized protein BDZ99DRAFT_465054 [Mytilinidion resinicola]|uniref:C2H2-type domain-containing protein n=1 Tax=Mytilinidion resinicola TaxID=574789 RepID=A0A6A6YE73_9PEZI|nr:uncharacterized protein BDZ99DRAFT_465054 [Mytilinidion resinicola]KAF2807122.1 hypothetical protein BDZ99DRAFT_465054 [Mytilinidion resinicola]